MKGHRHGHRADALGLPTALLSWCQALRVQHFPENGAMQSRWNDAHARNAAECYAEQGIGEDLALRTYSTRLLGCDPLLVLHGGGNTSVKTTMADLLGEEVAVLCVKGSGSDMAAIEPAGLPAVRLDRLCKLRARAAFAVEEVVGVQAASLIDTAADD